MIQKSAETMYKKDSGAFTAGNCILRTKNYFSVGKNKITLKGWGAFASKLSYLDKIVIPSPCPPGELSSIAFQAFQSQKPIPLAKIHDSHYIFKYESMINIQKFLKINVLPPLKTRNQLLKQLWLLNIQMAI